MKVNFHFSWTLTGYLNSFMFSYHGNDVVICIQYLGYKSFKLHNIWPLKVNSKFTTEVDVRTNPNLCYACRFYRFLFFFTFTWIFLIERVLSHALWIPLLSSQKNVSAKGEILRKADLILKGKKFCFVGICHILFNLPLNFTLSRLSLVKIKGVFRNLSNI